MECEIYQVGADRAPTEDEIRIASSGPGFVRPLLGDDTVQFELLRGEVDWSRIFFARVDGEIAGYLQFFLHGRGPHRVRFGPLRARYGTVSGGIRFLAARALFGYVSRFEAYGYKLVVRPGHRGRWIGVLLGRRLLEHAGAQGASHVHLQVWSTNQAALAVYRRLRGTAYGALRIPFMKSGDQPVRLLWVRVPVL